MSKILVVGNIIKDVYLSLDQRQNNFEVDGDGKNWLDLRFDGSSYKYFQRASMLGGVAVSVNTLEQLGMDVEATVGEIDFSKAHLECDCEYRYILCNDKQICYLTSDERRPAVWKNPSDVVDWIYIDRSVTVTATLIQKIRSYAALSKKTRLAYFIGKQWSSNEAELAKMSNIVFYDGAREDINTRGIVCKIEDSEIALGPLRMEWGVDEDADLRTHLTMHATIAATVFAALLIGRTARDALLMAKINVENSTLNKSLDLARLEKMVQAERQREKDLELIASSLVAKGKGILAADESGGSIHKKFEQAKIPDNYESRREYRKIFVTTPDLEKYVSGVILFDETAKQDVEDGKNFVEYLTERGVIPGIKVDKGLVKYSDSEETWTDGLDGLSMRLAEYYELGLRFAKWRAAFEIRYEGDKMITPTAEVIKRNAEILARYAKSCQNNGIVPIIEPEVVHDGDYSLETCAKVTGEVLDETFRQLKEFDVDLKACLLKCNMVLAGKQYELQTEPKEVGAVTAEVLKNHVPETLAGVVFLSGGQGVEQATENLKEVLKNGPFPWPVTFSYARALQGPALEAWQGEAKNIKRAQEAFKKRLVANTDVLK